MFTDVIVLTASALIPPAVGYGIYRWRLLRKAKAERRPLEKIYEDIGRELDGPAGGAPQDPS